MNYEAEFEDIEEIKVASIKYTGDNDEGIDHMKELYMKFKKIISGPFCSMYFSADYSDVKETECCVPVIEEFESDDKFKFKVLPAQRALCVLHIGRYEELGNAFTFITGYVRKNGLQVEYPIRLVYQKGPGLLFKGNPEKYETKIIVPII
ncbi:GyrI-like domain-containing protein [Ruminococcus flavefaciens]|uniref:GyrI-like domain-containing protein n=1 Tax=Ruminococcus flavefaciens TaxID=1265 RepID=UPI00048A6BB5|nr:GyrI-like domain-containing protein [Ruminococcus flavefaciens]